MDIDGLEYFSQIVNGSVHIPSLGYYSFIGVRRNSGPAVAQADSQRLVVYCDAGIFSNRLGGFVSPLFGWYIISYLMREGGFNNDLDIECLQIMPMSAFSIPKTG